MGGIHPSEQSKMRRPSFSCQALVRPIRIVALLLVLVLGACASETADDEGPIVIGLAIGLTDFMAAYDLPALNGAQIAVDEINEAGGVLGRSLEIVTADTKSDIDQGTVAGQEVIDQGAHAMIVSPDYNMGGGAARAAQDAGLVVFSSSAGSPLFGIEGIGPLAFTMGIAATTDGAVAAEWAFEDQGFRTAYLLLDDIADYNKDYCRAFETRWVEQGGTIAGQDQFNNNDASIASQVTRINGLPEAPDIIALCSFPPGGAVATKQLRDGGVDAPIVSNNGFDGDFWYKDSMPDLADFYYTSPVSFWGDDPSAEVGEFLRKYLERHGQPQAVSAIGAYAAVYALAEAIEDAGTTDGEAVAGILEQFDGRNVGGLNVTFSPDLHIDKDRELRILELNAGAHQIVSIRSAKGQPPLFG